MRLVAVVQARLASTRLPGKVLADLSGRPMLWHVLTRVRLAEELIGMPLVLTTPVDDVGPIMAALDLYRLRPCWIEHDPPELLEAFYWAALVTHADAVVRITSDCPLIPTDVINETVQMFRRYGVDYRGTTRPTLVRPDGFDVEVVRTDVLRQAVKEATGEDREHVTSFIWSQPERFRLGSVPDLDDPAVLDLKLSVDHDADLERVRRIMAVLPPEDYTMAATLKAAREVGL
jgi:spore coat polysaccharide biosynthesis protein SpsF (cytidylyltransferase family)